MIDLTIPDFLVAKNPENRAIRAKSQAKQATEQAAKRALLATLTTPKTPIVKKVAKEKGIPVVESKPIRTKPADYASKPKQESAIRENQIIRVLTKDFGHKSGSKAEKKSAALRDGMTVAEYTANDLGFAGKWHKSHIQHCLGKGFIKLEE